MYFYYRYILPQRTYHKTQNNTHTHSHRNSHVHKELVNNNQSFPNSPLKLMISSYVQARLAWSQFAIELLKMYLPFKPDESFPSLSISKLFSF